MSGHCCSTRPNQGKANEGIQEPTEFGGSLLSLTSRLRGAYEIFETGTGVRSPVHADGTSVRHIAAAEEELRADEDGATINVQISAGMMRQMIGIQQDIHP